MAQTNYRTINIDLLDPDSPANFDLSTLTPSVLPISTQDVQNNVNQIRQMLRGGDSEGALRAALEAAPYGADMKGKVGFTFVVYMAYGLVLRYLGHGRLEWHAGGERAQDSISSASR